MTDMTNTKKILLTAVIAAVLIGILSAVFFIKSDDDFKKIESLEDLRGEKIAMLTGCAFAKTVEEKIENVQIYFNDNESDSSIMLETGKVKGWATDEPIARNATKENPNFRIVSRLTEDSYAYIFNKESEKAQKLCEQMNAFLAKIKSDGTLKEIDSLWFGDDEEAKVVNIPTEGENGQVIFATSFGVGKPFAYVKDGKYAGYDIDIAAHFCCEYGYSLEIRAYDFSGLLGAVQADKGCDFGGGCITVTEERKEKLLFSDANYEGGVVVIVNDENPSSDGTSLSEFIGEQIDGFNSTFIKESRWKLFLQGIGNTLLITALSVLFGTAVGFALFWLSRNTGKAGNRLLSLFTKLIDGMPVVVLLMVLYYVIFGKSSLSNIAVSAIGFSLIFGSGVLGALIRSTDTVSRAQTEASLALGFTKSQTFMKIVLPQAVRHVLPVFKSKIVELLKGTSIVGYLAVQDLTKMSDIVRGSSGDAFFPLIATAVIYFLLEFILISLVNAIQINTDTKRRPAQKILKGIKTK